MPKLRIGSFNCENLFVRYEFNKGVTAERRLNFFKAGLKLDAAVYHRTTPAEKKLTARVIEEADADVIGLVEVEGLDALKTFRDEFLPKAGYRYAVAIDGNDPRWIDVALLSRHPVGEIRTHQFLPSKDFKGQKVFSRDMLEVEVLVSGKPFRVFVNHFKSMLSKKKGVDARADTTPRRREQARVAAEIVSQRFGGKPGDGAWAIVGDLNDYYDEGPGGALKPAASLAPLLGKPWIVDAVANVPSAADRWTYFYERGKKYNQLDYILLPRALDLANGSRAPDIIRKGMSTAALRYVGPRFPGVTKKAAASDHCALALDVSF